MKHITLDMPVLYNVYVEVKSIVYENIKNNLVDEMTIISANEVFYSNWAVDVAIISQSTCVKNALINYH